MEAAASLPALAEDERTLTHADARRLTDEVKADAQALWRKLLALYEGGAHTALGYSTWWAYCAAEFDLGKSRAYQLLEAGQTLDTLRAHSNMLESPTTDRVVRELSPLRDEPEQMAQAWAEAVEQHGEQPTAAEVREVVRATAAAKDRERKARSDEARAAKREDDDQAPTALVTFHHGDCRTLAADLEPASVRLLLTDPPYGQQYRTGYRWASEHRPITGDSQDALSLTVEALEAVAPALTQDAHVLVFCRWQHEHELREALIATGLTVRGSLVWAKNEHGMGDLRRTFGPAHERIVHATRPDATIRYREPDVLHVPRVVNERHPTEKPVDLLRRLVVATTEPGDLVVDPFAGVASTLVAASQAGRRGWGCEIDPDYYRLGGERLAD